jgi:hypothetical protein
MSNGPAQFIAPRTDGRVLDTTLGKMRSITERYGAEALDIVVELGRELNVGIDDALDIASHGSPEFRAACERHLVRRKADAAAERAERARREAIADTARQRNTLTDAIANLVTAGKRARTERENAHDAVRAGQMPPLTVEQKASLDGAVAQLEADLVRAEAQLAAWDAARDDEKVSTYERLMAGEPAAPAPKKTNRKTKES